MATRTISTKLAIDGESEYRAALTRINTEIKTLQSSLKLTESQYQTNANSMQALTAKGEALSALYTAQKAKVEELRAALANAKSAEEEYAKQKATLTARIEENNKKLEELRSTTGDTTAQEKALTEENKELESQLQKCDASLEASEKGVNSWQTQLNNAEIKLNDLDAEIQQNDKYLEEAQNSTDGCAKSIDQYGKSVGEAADQTDSQSEALQELAGVLAAAGIKEGLEKIKDALMACVTAASDFNYAMSGVAAIANASAEEVDALTAKAQEIGASTMFTASQAAEALQYMALAGWNASEMLAGVDGVINLAAASGENLGTVSDIVTDALTAFGLTASDTSHFVDVLAKTSASSNTTVTMLGEAFKYAAPVAGALGYSIEDVAVAMGLMANNGIKGSTAGTTLRNVFSALTGEVKLSSSAFGDVVLSGQNADGTMKSFSETIDTLKVYFNQMTEAEQVNNAQALVGTRAYAGLLAILNSTEDDYNSLTAAIQECTGAAEAMAETRLDNLAGDVTILNSAVDGLKIEIGNQLTPALRELTQSGTDVVDWAHNFIAANDGMVECITILVTVSGVFVGTLTALSVASGVLTKAMTALNAVLAANPWILAAAAVAGLATAIIAISAATDSAVPSVKELTTAASEMQDTLGSTGEALSDSLTTIEASANMADRYITKLEELEAAGLDTTEAQREYHSTLVLLCETVPELAAYINLETDTITGGTEALRENTNAWRENAEQQAYQEQLTELYTKHASVLLEVEENNIRLAKAQQQLTAAQEAQNSAFERMDELMAEAQSQADAWYEQTGQLTEASQWLSQEYYDLQDSLGGLNDQVGIAEETVANYQTAIENDTEAVSAANEEIALMEEAVDSLTSAAEESTAAIEDNADAMCSIPATAETISASLSDLAQKYKEAYDASYDSINGQIGLFGEFAAEISEDVDTVEEMMQRWAEQEAALAQYTENLKLAAEYGVDEGLVKSLSDGSAESAGYLQIIIDHIEELGGSTEGMSTDAAAFVDDFNASFAKTEEARDSFAQTAAGIQEDLAATVGALEQQAADVSFDGFHEAFNTAFANVGINGEEVGRNLGLGLSSGIDGTTETAKASAQAMAESVISGAKSTLQVQSPSGVFREIGENVDLGLSEGIEGQTPTATSSAETMSQAVVDAARGIFGISGSSLVFREIGGQVDTGLSEGVDGNAGDVTSSVEDMTGDVVERMETGSRDSVDKFDAEFSKITARTNLQIASLKSAIDSAFSPLPGRMSAIGLQIVNGMISGINTRSGALYSTVRSVVNNAIAAARSAAAVASPSKKTTEIFEYVGEGMIVGLEHKRQKVSDTAKDVVASALKLDIPQIDMPDIQIPEVLGTNQITDIIRAIPKAENSGDKVVNLTINVQKMDEANTNYVIRRVNEEFGAVI